jgi:pantoate--beta-alanine ligase
MLVTHSIAECREARRKLGRLAFVPTMGALHEGHVSLMKIARQHAEQVAVSIFVNPTQFGPNEDFHKYPRPIERDLAMCRDAGVDLVFNPAPQDMYPPGSPEISIDLPQLTTVLEGASRPGHFKGVCQVVAKLFNIVQPQVACFGQKDFQQLAILQAMTRALDFPIEIIPCPTLREPDGLAMSSRNRYLSADERTRALSISRGLFAAQDLVTNGERSAARLIQIVTDSILNPGQLPQIPVKIDYVAVVDVATLQPVETLIGSIQIPVAVRVGSTRLIDNINVVVK